MKKRRSIKLILAVAAVFTVACGISKSASTNSASRSDTNSDNGQHGHSANSTAPAPSIAGKYNVVGTNPDEVGSYRGTLEVVSRGAVYQFRWNAGTQYDGVGVQIGNVVAVAYANGTNGTGCGVVDYSIKDDGTLDGKWGYWGTNQSGTEIATRTSGSGLEGQYDATGRNPDGKPYKATLTVEPAGNLYRFVWSNNADGIGVRQGDNIAVGIGGARCGFVAYQVSSDGTLEGIWGGGGSDKTGTERATKQ